MDANQPQLRMVWPMERLDNPPRITVPAGYQLQLCTRSDEGSFLALMDECGWKFDEARMQYCRSRLLPAGWFSIREIGAERVIASAMSLHNYTGQSMCAGTLGWVGCLPSHRGNGLGAVVASAATARLIEAGYTDVELYTEHHREPAIAIYWNLGYVPYIYSDPVLETWRVVCARIGVEFLPDHWPRGDNAYPTT